MKKSIVIILIIMICINTLLPNLVLAKTVQEPNLGVNKEHIFTENTFNQIEETGEAHGSTNKEATVNQKDVPIAVESDRSVIPGTEQSSFIASTLALLIRGIAYVMNQMMTVVVNNSNFTEKQFEDYKVPEQFTIERLVFGEYDLFNINYFNIKGDSLNAKMKTTLTGWYYAIRNIAIVASLVVLLYIAIKMSISTVASDEVKYKRMLKNWFISFILLFFLHYIVALFIYLSDYLVQLLNVVRNGQQIGFEQNCIQKIYDGMGKGWNAFIYAVMYFIIVVYQIKFFVLYIKRFILSGFLFMIAPLVTITYPIDKAKDNKAQAFGAWNKEMISVIFIQPLHALLFIVFMVSAGTIIDMSPILAIIFLFALSSGEKLLKEVFKLGGSLKSVDDSFKFNPGSLLGDH